jgi:hypothetical protein
MHLEDSRKPPFYVALKALIRGRDLLLGGNALLRVQLDTCFENCVALLQGQATSFDFRKFDGNVEKLIVDEQDAGFEQVLENRLYFALSSFNLFFLENDVESLNAAAEDVVEIYRYKVAHDHLFSRGSRATILSSQDEDEIEKKEEIQNEISAQMKDRKFAAQTSDWSAWSPANKYDDII